MEDILRLKQLVQSPDNFTMPVALITNKLFYHSMPLRKNSPELCNSRSVSLTMLGSE